MFQHTVWEQFAVTVYLLNRVNAEKQINHNMGNLIKQKAYTEFYTGLNVET